MCGDRSWQCKFARFRANGLLHLPCNRFAPSAVQSAAAALSVFAFRHLDKWTTCGEQTKQAPKLGMCARWKPSILQLAICCSLSISLSLTHTQKANKNLNSLRGKRKESLLCCCCCLFVCCLLLHYLFFFFFFSKQSGVERLCSWKDLIENDDEHCSTRFVVVVGGIGYDLVA